MKKGIKLSVVGLTTVAGLLLSTNVLASEVAKDGNQIQVTEPEITYNAEASETYVNKELTYHTEIPDEIDIEEGDTLTYTLPEQLQWTTTQEFDVTSPEGEVVGRAVASNDSQNVTTTFNGYFKEHPLNKQFDMTLSTMWKKEVVKEGQKYDLSFNGTVVQQAEVKPQGKANPTEIVVANAKGSAKGTIRPYSWDVPPGPVYDIPEYTGDAVPLDPPVYEKPELDITGIPEMPPAPIYELPEWQGGTTPLDPPTVDKPEWNGGVVPNDPPVLDLPELVIPEEPKSLEKEPPAPSTKEEPKNAAESKLEASASGLPKTGEVSNVFLSIFGISLLISGAMIWQDNKKK